MRQESWTVAAQEEGVWFRAADEVEKFFTMAWRQKERQRSDSPTQTSPKDKSTSTLPGDMGNGTTAADNSTFGEPNAKRERSAVVNSAISDPTVELDQELL